MTENKYRTIQFIMILVSIFKPINVDKRKEIAIVALVLKNTFDNCVTFAIISHLDCHYVFCIQLTLDFGILYILDVRYTFVEFTISVD